MLSLYQARGRRRTPIWRIFSIAWALLAGGVLRRTPFLGEVRRINLPRPRVNEGMRKGRDPAGPRPFSFSSASLLAHQLLLGLIHQSFLFPLLFCCCSSSCCDFLLP